MVKDKKTNKRGTHYGHFMGNIYKLAASSFLVVSC